jgi:uncharacterized protein YaiI (UPF0178 family)
VTLWVDADGCPADRREIAARAAVRCSVTAVFVADRSLQMEASRFVATRLVTPPEDADRHILDVAAAGDLAVTADLPLAAELVEKGVHVIHPQGDLYTRENVGERRSMRDFLEGLRRAGTDTKSRAGQHHRQRAKRRFAAILDRELNRGSRQGDSP